MDELHGRFRRLDRVAAPNLWNEAVGRAAELGVARRRVFTPAMGLVAAGLLLAALAGSVAVGTWLSEQLSPESEPLTYDNGMMVAESGCGLMAVDPRSFERRQLVSNSCGFGTSWPAWSRDGSHLAYSVPWMPDDADAAGLWLYEAATGETRHLTQCQPEPPCEFGQVDISPDASLVAFIGHADELPNAGVSALVVTVVASGETYRVPLPGFAGRPAFSPDGDHIAVPLLGGKSGVYLVDVSSAEDGVVGTPFLLHGIVEAADLAWSPDSKWIAMTQTGGLDYDRPAWHRPFSGPGKGVVIISADGIETRFLVSMPASDAPTGPGPTWSADSQTIAYVTRPVGDAAGAADAADFEVWTVTIDGGEPTRIYDTDCCVNYYSAAVWSPDGEWIAFGVDNPGKPSESGTFLLRPDGSERREVSREVLYVVWQPIPRD